jgi:hypothetical protein
MPPISRRTLIGSAWAAPVVAAAVAAPAAAASQQLDAGTLNLFYTYSQYPGSVNWSFTVTNTSGLEVPMTVTFAMGPFTFNGWLGATWNRSGTTYTTKANVLPGATTGTATIVFAAPPGTSGVAIGTVSAPGAKSVSFPISITIPQ